MTTPRKNHYELTRIRQRGLFTLALMVLTFLGFQYRPTAPKPPRETKVSLPAQRITIEVKGSIARPGLYTYPYPPTVEQVIRDAQGLKGDQGLPAIRSGKTLDRNSTLAVKSTGHGLLGIDQAPLSVKASWILGQPISINQANEEDLDFIPGIGPGLARRIIAYRQDKGGFSTLDELMEVDGIKEKTLEKIKGYLTL
ncbi:MAG: ComEA family DNA-binding protein [Thermodesulfobacteriota bacterium]